LQRKILQIKVADLNEQTVSGTHPAHSPVGTLPSVVTRPKREANYSPPFISDVQNAWSYVSSLYVFTTCYLNEHRTTLLFCLSYMHHLCHLL